MADIRGTDQSEKPGKGARFRGSPMTGLVEAIEVGLFEALVEAAA